MKKKFAVLLFGMIGLPGVAFSQSAMEVATQSGACGGGTILAAQYLDDGRIQVRCPPGAGAQAGAAGATGAAVPGVLAGTGLGAGAAVGLLAAVAVVIAASGGDGGTVTTTTTTSP